MSGQASRGPGLAERLRAYMDNVEKALEALGARGLSGRARDLAELARAYLSDSKYYAEAGDLETALACVAYAEGLLDALRLLGIAEFEWQPLSKLLERPKVLVAGSFEILHPGHLHLLRKAWEMGRVYVVVARDSNVERFKGRRPVVPEEHRRRVVESVKYVHAAVLGDERDVMKPVEDIKPDVILLGPDQWASEEWLRRELEKRGMRGVRVVRLLERVGDDLYSATGILAKACSQLSSQRRTS